MAGGAAQRSDVAERDGFLPTGTDGPAPLRAAQAEAGSHALKQAVAERLAAHRNRRAAEKTSEAEQQARAQARADAARTASRRGAAMVREAVAARYQQSQSYREFLAAEAERALQQAQAEAEVAARTMQAVAEAQQKLLDELEQWKAEEPSPREVAQAQVAAEARSELAYELADIAMGARELIAEPPLLTIVETPRPALTVKLSEEVKPVRLNEAKALRVEMDVVEDEIAELDEEISFRRAPEFMPTVLETQAIPANIIEFPRQLIAPRKARPRLAEGPLLEDGPREPQLRIFEVEPELIAAEPQAQEVSGFAGWQSLVLDSTAAVRPEAPFEAQANLTFQPQAAPKERRLMAAAVDGVCVLTGFVLFATTVAYFAGAALHEVKGTVIAGTAAVCLGVFFLLYQMLCFTFSDATPGMRYARIGLCTFADENPTRKAMRLRTLAMLLAACPLGLGLAWMLMDDDGLGWHDRISRMYQRAY